MTGFLTGIKIFRQAAWTVGGVIDRRRMIYTADKWCSVELSHEMTCLGP